MSQQKNEDKFQHTAIYDPSKYIQWGVSNPQPLPSPSNDYTHRQSQQGLNQDKLYSSIDGKMDTNEEGKAYYTEYSQVSGIETGFKKLKSNQIQILKELKKEYEILRNSSVDSKIIVKRKLGSESDSNLQQNSERKSSRHSRMHKSRRHDENRQLSMIILEKKQLELIVNSSMKKIEELLHNEIELKKTIVDLKSKINSQDNSSTEYQFILKKMKTNQHQILKSVEQKQKQIERLKQTIRQLNQNIGNLEGTLLMKDMQIKKVEEGKKLVEEQIRIEKSKYLLLELDLKKATMEYEMLQKSKKHELQFYLKNKSMQSDQGEREYLNTVRRLEEEIQLKDKRYKFLLDQMSNLPHNKSSNQGDQNKKYYQELIKKLLEQKTSSNLSQSVNLILNKVSELQKKPENSIQSQLQSLKNQIEFLKNDQLNSHRQSYLDKNEDTESLKQRIKELQKIIEQENEQKIQFFEGLNRLTKDYNEIKRQRDNLTNEIRDYRREQSKYREQIRRYKNDLDAIKNINLDLSQSQYQNNNLKLKLQHYNLKELELDHAKIEIEKIKDNYKTKQEAYEQQIRNLKRKVDQHDFKAQKAVQEGEFKLNLIKSQHKSEIKRIQDEGQQLKQSLNIIKNELEDQKQKYEIKLAEKENELKILLSKLNQTDKGQLVYIQSLKKQCEERLKIDKEKHLNEINNLIQKIEGLTNSNERYIQQSVKYAQIEQDNNDLKRTVRQSKKFSENIDHLWQVKQAQYANINLVFEKMK